MNVARESRILEIAKEAAGLSHDKRQAFIEAQCEGDPAMREEVLFFVSVLDMPQEQSFLSRFMQSALAEADTDSSGDTSWRQVARPGQVIGLYRLLEPLGEGGMGSVFLAEQTEPVSRKVALKLVKMPQTSQEVYARLKVEPQMMAMLSHPNIAQVFDVGSTPEGLLYFAMEFVDGEPITDYCHRKRVGLKDRLRILIQVCRGVHHAHQKAILHRDLKPSNILVTEIDGRPIAKIIDFGIASSVSESSSQADLAGTPLYMSPEALLADGQGVDTRTDVYALGVLLFELIVGVKPFELKGLTVYSVMKKLAHETVPVPSDFASTLAEDTLSTIAMGLGEKPAKMAGRLRGELDWITAKAVARKREDRYESPRQFAQDLERFLDGEPLRAAPAHPLYHLKKHIRRNLFRLAFSGLVLVLLIAGIAARTLEANRAKAEAEKARIALAESQEVTAFLKDIFESAKPDNHQGQVPSVENLVNQARERIAQAFPDQPLLRAKMLFILSDVYTNLSDHDQEIELMGACLALRQKHLPPNHVDIAEVSARLGMAYERLSQPQKAMGFQEKAFTIYREALGEDHPKTLAIRKYIAELNKGLGQFEQAEAMHLQALAGNQRLGDIDQIRSTREYLARLYLDLGRYREAEALMRLVQQANEEIPHVNLRYIAGCDLLLGSSLWYLGNYEAALQHHLKAFALRKEIYGLDHRFTGTTLRVLGKSYFALDRLDDAEQALQKAVAIQENRSAMRTSRALDLLGAVYIRQRRYGEADQALNRSLSLKQSLAGTRDFELGYTLRHLGDLYLDSGRAEDARTAYIAAKQSIEAGLGKEHPTLVPILTGLANCSLRAKDYENASVFLDRAKTLAVKKLHLETLAHQAVIRSINQLEKQRERL